MEENKKRTRAPRKSPGITHLCEWCETEITDKEWSEMDHLCKACYDFRERIGNRNK